MYPEFKELLSVLNAHGVKFDSRSQDPGGHHENDVDDLENDIEAPNPSSAASVASQSAGKYASISSDELISISN